MKIQLLFLITLLFSFVSCHKDKIVKDEDDNHICGCLYVNIPLSNLIENYCNTKIKINDSIYLFDRIEGILYSSTKVGTNQNMFLLNFSNNTSVLNSIEFNLYSPSPKITAEEFFQTGTQNIDTMEISNLLQYNTFTDFYKKSNVELTWDTVNYENMTFHGSGHLEILDTLWSKLNSSCYYPPQKIEFVLN